LRVRGLGLGWGVSRGWVEGRGGGRAFDLEVAADEGFGHVDCFNVDFDAVFLVL